MKILGYMHTCSADVKIIHNEVICCYYRIHDGNSIRRDMNFNREFNNKLHQRNQAYQLIIEKLNNCFHNELENIKYY